MSKQCPLKRVNSCCLPLFLFTPHQTTVFKFATSARYPDLLLKSSHNLSSQQVSRFSYRLSVSSSVKKSCDQETSVVIHSHLDEPYKTVCCNTIMNLMEQFMIK